jgi:hypothetical protein
MLFCFRIYPIALFANLKPQNMHFRYGRMVFVNFCYLIPELFGPGHFVGLGLGLRLKSEIRSRTRT